jgi:basic amino acid/polyamine antiporter, APA family
MPNTSPPDSAPSSAAPKRQLTLFDSTCIIVGIIIGTGVYMQTNTIASAAGSGWGLLGLWLLGGVLSLCGAMGYAELASAYPREGGDYVYLTKAYGPWAGFMFGWLQLLVVRPADIAGMAFGFGLFATQILNPLTEENASYMVQVYAVSAVALFTLVNIAGVQQGKWTQNLLTVVKALGVLAIIGVAMFVSPSESAPFEGGGCPWRVALIIVLFCYGGWNEMAYVAAEVKDPNRNIIRALMLGTGAVILLYLLLNAAFLHTLGHAGMVASKLVAADSVSIVLGDLGGQLISALICISALGAVNGLTFTGARISFAVGTDHPLFRPLAVWNAKTGTPVRALLLQGAIASTLIIAIGSFLETVIYAAAAVYLFYAATNLAVIVLRAKEPQVPRPYRVTLYPLPTLVFCAACVLMIHGAFLYKPLLSYIALGIVALGLPVYWLTTPRRAAE